MSEAGFKITGFRVLPEPMVMKRGARVLATFHVETHGFRFLECRLYHVPDKGWGWWTPNPRVTFLRDMRGPVKQAAKAIYAEAMAPQ